jgi:chromosome segregation ATPase
MPTRDEPKESVERGGAPPSAPAKAWEYTEEEIQELRQRAEQAERERDEWKGWFGTVDAERKGLEAEVDELEARAEQAEATLEAVSQLAVDLIEHLDYCGWGDRWEKEVSEKLRIRAITFMEGR